MDRSRLEDEFQSAINNGHEEIVELILEAGVNLDGELEDPKTLTRKSPTHDQLAW